MLKNALKLRCAKAKSKGMGTIGDVANWKCHQWVDEVLIFFTRTTSEKSAKLFKKQTNKQTLSCNTPGET